MDSVALSLWQALAYQTVWRLAATMNAFSSDDVWSRIEDLPTPDDPRALGPILTRCAKDGLVHKSDMVVKSQRRVCHGRPVNVWISVVRGAKAIDAAEYVAAKKTALSPPLLFDMPDTHRRRSAAQNG